MIFIQKYHEISKTSKIPKMMPFTLVAPKKKWFPSGDSARRSPFSTGTFHGHLQRLRPKKPETITSRKDPLSGHENLGFTPECHCCSWFSLCFNGPAFQYTLINVDGVNEGRTKSQPFPIQESKIIQVAVQSHRQLTPGSV